MNGRVYAITIETAATFPARDGGGWEAIVCFVAGRFGGGTHRSPVFADRRDARRWIRQQRACARAGADVFIAPPSPQPRTVEQLKASFRQAAGRQAEISASWEALRQRAPEPGPEPEPSPDSELKGSYGWAGPNGETEGAGRQLVSYRLGRVPELAELFWGLDVLDGWGRWVPPRQRVEPEIKGPQPPKLGPMRQPGWVTLADLEARS